MLACDVADALVWKISSEGTTLWAERAGGAGEDVAVAAAVDANGDAVFSGALKGLLGGGVPRDTCSLARAPLIVCHLPVGKMPDGLLGDNKQEHD